jgi:hypothetical protein
VVLALVTGCTLAFQAYYIWHLNEQVGQLQVKVCHYQQGAHRLATALAEAGHPVPPGTLPEPEPCP